MPYLNKFGHQLVKNGYEIVPIKPGAKAPSLPGWQNIRATCEDVEKWANNGHRDGGIGVLCRNVIAVDIDCYTASLNHQLLDWLKDNVGAGPIRVGQKPKCIMVLRTEEPMTKLRSAEFEDPAGNRNAVEVLATGQQFVAYGIHPGTKREYSWPTTHLADTPRDSIPVITRAQAEAFIAHFEKLAGDRGWELVRGGAAQPTLDPEDITNLRPKLGASIDELREMVDAIDPDAHHDEWIKVGMALHHETDGGDEGLELWDEWSSRGDKYREGECGRRWGTFANDGKVPVTGAYLKRQTAVAESEAVTEERLPAMLRNWAFVQVEGAARVIREDLPSHHLVLYRLEDLKKEHQNCLVLDFSGEKPKRQNLVDKWLEDPDRRTYAAGLAFAPDSDVLGRYNLWRGWSYEASEGDVGPWLDFITNVIACGDEDHANYIVAWCAQMVQEPMSKLGVALVLRGRKGTGKTKFGELLGGLCKPHHKIVARSEHVTGHFNKHLEDTLLLQADEAFWAGAKGSEGALKDLITNPEITIERKGVDAYSAPNYTRVLFTSNEEWVVPASLDERRFAVFDVSTTRQQDSAYFAALDRWYRQGGAAAILHYLRAFDLSKVNVRAAPRTRALTDQQLESLSSVDSWLLAALQNGELREHRVAGDKLEWGEEVSKAQLYHVYCSSVTGRFEDRFKESAFWKKLRGYRGLLLNESQRSVAGVRVRMVSLAPVQDARRAFAEAQNLTIDWPELAVLDPMDPAGWDEEDIPF